MRLPLKSGPAIYFRLRNGTRGFLRILTTPHHTIHPAAPMRMEKVCTEYKWKPPQPACHKVLWVQTLMTVIEML